MVTMKRLQSKKILTKELSSEGKGDLSIFLATALFQRVIYGSKNAQEKQAKCHPYSPLQTLARIISFSSLHSLFSI